MKVGVSSSIVLSLMLIGTDWVSASTWQSTVTLAVEVSSTTCVPVGRLINVQGQVQLKRQGWSGYHLTAIGTVLCLGDLLRPAQGARVIVQCAGPNRISWYVPGGITSGAALGCHPPPPIRIPALRIPGRSR
jgi:hypothetical protein